MKIKFPASLKKYSEICKLVRTSLLALKVVSDFDKEGFENEMGKQKSRSRGATSSKVGDWIILKEFKKENFVGYDKIASNMEITRYRKMKTNKDGDFYQLTFDETPFYPEGGGQVGDTGVIENKNFKFEVIDTLKRADKIIEHVGKIITGEIEIGYEAL